MNSKLKELQDERSQLLGDLYHLKEIAQILDDASGNKKLLWNLTKHLSMELDAVQCCIEEEEENA